MQPPNKKSGQQMPTLQGISQSVGYLLTYWARECKGKMASPFKPDYAISLPARNSKIEKTSS
jgi:hypothetical protein